MASGRDSRPTAKALPKSQPIQRPSYEGFFKTQHSEDEYSRLLGHDQPLKIPTRLKQNLGQPPKHPESNEFTSALKASWSKSTHRTPAEASWSESLLTYAVVLILCIAVSLPALLFFYPRVSTKIFSQSFCSSDMPDLQNCVPCPNHGICYRGTLTCESDYIQSGAVCILSDKVIESYRSSLVTLVEKLQKETEKSYIANRTSICLSESEAHKIIRPPSSLKPEIRSQLELMMSEYNLVHEKEIDKLCYKLKHFNLSFVGKTQLLWQQWSYYIIAGTIVLLYLVWKAKVWFTYYTDERMASNLYQKIKEQLKESADNNYDHGIIEDDVRETIYDLAGPKGQTIWKYVENCRKSDAAVCKFQGLSGGRPAVYWQWKGRIGTSIGDKLKRS